MLSRFLSVCLLLGLALVATGCGPGWVNQHYKDSDKMDAAFKHDNAFCQQQVDKRLPRPRNNERYSSGYFMADQLENYDIDMQRENLHDECLRNLGWKRK